MGCPGKGKDSKKDSDMRKMVQLVKVVTGGYNVFFGGLLYGWARMKDTAEEMGQVALLAAF